MKVITCCFTIYSLFNMTSDKPLHIRTSTSNLKDDLKELKQNAVADKTEYATNDNSLQKIWSMKYCCLIFFLVVFNVVKTALKTFGVIFARKELRSTNYQCGLMVLFSTMFEWPLMFFGGELLHFLGGESMLVLSGIATVFRSFTSLRIFFSLSLNYK